MSSLTDDTRQGELDRVLERQQPSQQLSDDLFAVADALDSEPMLRRTLTDPGVPMQAREQMARQLFGGKVSDGAVAILATASQLRWPSGKALVAALERQGVRAELSAALAAGTLDTVEEQLFRFERVVVGNNQLREALGDSTRPLSNRRALVADLLCGKADQATVRLAQRAVAASERTFALTISHYLDLAAGLRSRLVAKVTAARELTSVQAERLTIALSKQVGRAVSIQVNVDPSVLGGIRVELGDDIIEGTVAGRLDQARRQLG